MRSPVPLYILATPLFCITRSALHSRAQPQPPHFSHLYSLYLLLLKRSFHPLPFISLSAWVHFAPLYSFALHILRLACTAHLAFRTHTQGPPLIPWSQPQSLEGLRCDIASFAFQHRSCALGTSAVLAIICTKLKYQIFWVTNFWSLKNMPVEQKYNF